jgi:MFS transporter, MFS domain-containing protein family, molybdate-anion transporter
MDLYKSTFAISILFNSLFMYSNHRTSKATPAPTSDKGEEKVRTESDLEGISKLKRRFYPIYLLVNAADWLQGPFIYPIYKGIYVLDSIGSSRLIMI